MAKIDVNTLKNKDGKLDFEKVKVLKPILENITKDELIEMSIKANRDPFEIFPDRLPTQNKMPLPPDEHKHIGLYESKQTLYLLIAHSYNKVMERLDKLEKGGVK